MSHVHNVFNAVGARRLGRVVNEVRHDNLVGSANSKVRVVGRF